MLDPLIVITNDDGIDSTGLWAAVEAVLELGEVLVVAPDRQWSGGGRSMPPDATGRLSDRSRSLGSRLIKAYAVDASPALAVVHAITELAPRQPSLVISGINYGANLSTEVTVSGTVGAALEAASYGIPGMAVSLTMDPIHHLTGNDAADYTASQAYIVRFARILLSHSMPPDVDVLSINLPADATPLTPWRLAPLSRRRVYSPTAPDRAKGNGRPGYEQLADGRKSEPGSDIWTVMVDGMVAVTPLSLDLTSRVSLSELQQSLLSGESLDRQAEAEHVHL